MDECRMKTVGVVVIICSELVIQCQFFMLLLADTIINNYVKTTD